MLPQNVYDHIKFGSGAKPGACYKDDKGSYSLENKTGHVVCTFYPLGFCEDVTIKSQSVPLSDIPSTQESDWDIYWTNEC